MRLATALLKRMLHLGARMAFVVFQAGKGSATLSMAYAAAAFGDSCLRALAGQPGIVECAYIDSQLTDLPYFASQVKLGPTGIEVSLLSLAVHLLRRILQCKLKT